MTDDRRRRPGRPRSEQAHDAVLAAARELLAEVGYPRLTIEGVAARAGVGKTTIYRWWSSKAELVAEILYRPIGIEEIPESGSPRDDLATNIRLLVEPFADPWYGPALTGARNDLNADPEGQKAFQAQIMSGRRATGRAVFQRLIDAGDLPEDTDVDYLIDVMSGLLVYRGVIWRQPITEDDIRKMVALLVDGAPPRRTPS
ncbi:TetR/AcrR family transcriptional regulator [Planobispora takensis]|uniref:TetR family transcriptional regulator n=1 Tax=Planobispora takensis TaxID=1367882 RepID=A0A8J3SY41_9ACTN|nr:TetR/AcrR family transcriptional regulator [Planobispora takensis]GII00843.1 TetR family transcriptional regulator [Planobispora takensis]